MSEALRGRLLATLLMPLACLPIFAVVPRILESHQLLDRRHKSAPLAAPAVRPSAELERLRPVPPFRGAIPVLAYEAVGADGPLAVHRGALAEQLAALRRLGFRSVSMSQYARFARGERVRLPARPVLITFDGGLLSSYRGADRILQRFGFRATIFVASGELQRENPDYLMWKELHSMVESGRWDVGSYGNEARRRISYDSRGDTGEFYAYRRFTRSDGREALDAFERRIATDLFDARERLAEQGFVQPALALPGGNYGQMGSNDGRIAPMVRDLATRQFGVVFTRDDRNAPRFARPGALVERYVLHAETRVGQLVSWLRHNVPSTSKERR